MYRKNLLLLAAASLVLLPAGSGLAQTTWTGTAGDNNWQQGVNWSTSLAPLSTEQWVVGDASSSRDITGAGGTTAGFNWSQSSAAVNQITLGQNFEVNAPGGRTFDNTSGNAANMVLDLNGYDFDVVSSISPGSTTIQTSQAGGTLTIGDGQLNSSNMVIGAGVEVRGPTYQGWTIYDAGTGNWDSTSVVRTRSTETPTSGLVMSGSADFANVVVENGVIKLNGGSQILGDLTFTNFGAQTSETPGGNGPYYNMSIVNIGGATATLGIGGSITDPNPLGNYAEGWGEGDASAIRLRLDGGGNVQVIDIAKTSLSAKLWVTADSHMKLANDFVSSYTDLVNATSTIESRTTIDLGTFDLDISHMNLGIPSAADRPTIIYAAGADSGSFHVGSLVHAGNIAFVIEDDPLSVWTDGDTLTLMSLDNWTGINELNANVTMPASWTYDAFVADPGGAAGTWRLTNVQTNGADTFIPEPSTMTLLLIGVVAGLLRRRLRR